MNLFGVMDITGSALKAERVRAEVVASNMSNAETTRTDSGGPYKRQHVVFTTANQGSFGDMMQSAGMNSGFSNSGQMPLFSTAQMTGQMPLPFGSNGGVSGGGVEVAGIVQDNSAPLTRYEPGNPDADANGYVAYPDINPLTEMVDLMGATRAYGMNASALQAEKNMVSSSLEILKS
jgi:flagellar basal-body rod protein FlgC